MEANECQDCKTCEFKDRFSFACDFYTRESKHTAENPKCTGYVEKS